VSEPQLRVVVADDNDAMRLAIADLIGSAEDLEVVGMGRNVEETLDLVASLTPDVVVTDVWMPGGGGAAVTEGVKRIGGVRGVVAISASSIRGTKEAVLAAGASAFLLKDTADKDLVRVIREVAESPRGALLETRTAEVVAVRVVDRFGSIFGWDAGAETLYGWTADEVLERTVGDFVVGPWTLDVSAEMMEELSLGRTWEGDFTHARKDRSLIKVHGIYVPVIVFGVVQCIVAITYQIP